MISEDKGIHGGGRLYHMAITEHPHLEYDEAKALAVKCTWALGAIGSAEAVEKLKLFAQSNNFIISDIAERQLSRVENSQKAI